MSGWLGTYKYRIKFTIPAAKVTADLTWFPVLVHLVGTDTAVVFTEIGTSTKKMAFTMADGLTQLYCEVVNWDVGGPEAELWISRDTWVLNNGVDNHFFLYYDATQDDNTTYIGDTGDTAAEAVWDTNFKIVCHMSDNPDIAHVMDSTSNDNDGTKKGNNEPNHVASCIYGAQDFDGSDDTITITNNSTLNLASTGGTWEFFASLEAAPPENYGFVYNRFVGGTPGSGYYCYVTNTDGKYGFGYRATTDKAEIVPNIDFRAAGWHHFMFTVDLATLKATIYIDGLQVGLQDTFTNDLIDNNNDLVLGGTANYCGILDETRISNTARSSDWAIANYNTQNDTFWQYVTTEHYYPSPVIGNTIHKHRPLPKEISRETAEALRDYLRFKIDAVSN